MTEITLDRDWGPDGDLAAELAEAERILSLTRETEQAYSPSQPRDDHGRWTHWHVIVSPRTRESHIESHTHDYGHDEHTHTIGGEISSGPIADEATAKRAHRLFVRRLNQGRRASVAELARATRA